MTVLGIDLGTSSLKAVLLDGDRIAASAEAPLALSQPRPQWSEQSPHDWWAACEAVVAKLQQQAASAWSEVAAIGLSGQMHGAVLLGADTQPLRPAILWNDTRSDAECAWLTREVPELSRITGNLAMPGFTAPKLVWVRRHEPDVFNRVAHVLLPKDWLRLQLSGELVSDLSDASGTLWLDVAKRRWSDDMLAACGLSRAQMPALVEGSAIGGRLSTALASSWGLRAGLPIAGGGGDNAASAVGIGATRPGEGFVSLGTSGVIFVVNERYSPNPAEAVHAFCHALPNRWHQMAVTLSAASCMEWLRRMTDAADVAALADEASRLDDRRVAQAPVFLPYLSGERTPHNDAGATAALIGLRGAHERADVAYAVLEGVAFSLAEGADALRAGGAVFDELSLVGGGSRSRFWGELIASAIDTALVLREAGELSAAIGAARLGRLASGAASETFLVAPPGIARIEPDAARRQQLDRRRAQFRPAYSALRSVREHPPQPDSS